MIQNPATTSFASVDGPSVMTRLPPDTRRRVPLELRSRPSAPSNTPAFRMSSLNSLMAMARSLAGGPFSKASGGSGQQHHKSHGSGFLVVSSLLPGLLQFPGG